MTKIILPFALLALALPAAAEVCRFEATTWIENGITYRTEISTLADNGCKRLTQSIDGIEEEGHDCNCDLIIDGREGHFKAPNVYSQERLLAICHGPEGVKVEEKPWLEIVED
jgi:hypothetical protein